MFDLSKSVLMDMYKIMSRIRCFEEKAIEVYRLGFIEGSVHTYVGEEAIAAGVSCAMNETDYVMSTHRGHGHLLSRGVEMAPMMAELMMRTTGISKARGGSMHMADKARRVLGTNGLVGGGLGMAVGASLSAKLRKTDQITVCFFGDGASNNGIFHEALNMAAIWKTPTLFVCENNGWAISSRSVDYVANNNDIAGRARAYGIPARTVDGNDVLDVYKTAKELIDGVRNGAGPAFMECKTWRRYGHGIGDAMTYRTERDHAEAAEWEKRDPLDIFKAYTLENQLLTEEELSVIMKSAENEAEAAFEFGKASPPATPENSGDFLAAMYVDSQGMVNEL